MALPYSLEAPSYWEPDYSPEPVPSWYFFSKDNDDWAFSEEERDALERTYLNAGIPYTIIVTYSDPD